MILTRSRQEATRWCTGSAPSVPKANHTFLLHVHRIDWAAKIVVAPTVPAERLASATHCSHCTLRWLQSMTLPGMVLVLSRCCHLLTNWLSGRMQAGTAGNKVLLTVLRQKEPEASELQSGLGSSSRPDMAYFDLCLCGHLCLFCICYFLWHCHVEIGSLRQGSLRFHLVLTWSHECLSTSLVEYFNMTTLKQYSALQPLYNYCGSLFQLHFVFCWPYFVV